MPISPNVVHLGADVLYISAAQACARGSLKGFQTYSQLLGIALLQYADDTLFFMEGSVEEAKNLSALLDVFTNYSGFRLNREKSEFTGLGYHKTRRVNVRAHWAHQWGLCSFDIWGYPFLRASSVLQIGRVYSGRLSSG